MRPFFTVRKLFTLMLALFFSINLFAQPEGELLVIIGTTDGEKRIVLLDAEDGTFVSDDYFDLSQFDMGTVKHVIRVGDELWVSDQTKDVVHRMDLEGNKLDSIHGEIDNLRGLRIMNDEVWLANSGTSNNAPGYSIIRISLAGEIIGNFPLPGSPWAFLPYGDDKALISFSTAGGFTTQIAEFDFAGNLIGSFTSPGELNFIQQIYEMENGQYLAASFSNATGGYPSGVHQYDENGTYLTVVGGTSGGGVRGTTELNNGNIVWTNGQGIHIADFASGTSSLVYAGSYQFVERINFGAATNTLPFAEDFELGTFPPAGWMAYNPDSSAVEWAASSIQNHTPGGQFSALHNYGSSGTMEDGWLVTPAITLPEFLEIQMSFWSYNTWPADYFKNSVLISTGDGNPLNGEFEEIWFAESVATEWAETMIDLSDFGGQTVYLAFRYEGEFAHGWFLDDIFIQSIAPVLEPPTDLQAVVSGSDVSLTWAAPAAKELLGYNVYRNNVKINTEPVAAIEYTDQGVSAGTHFYGVTAVYDNGESGQEGPVMVMLEGDFGKIQGFVRDAVTNLSIQSATLAAANTDNGAVSYSTPFGSHFTLLLPEGTYDLVCEADGYEPMTLENVVIMNGMVKSYTFYLAPETRELLTGISSHSPGRLSFYPNPATDFIHFTGDNLTEVQIFNQAGTMVVNQKIQHDDKVKISGIPAGIYFVKTISGNSVSIEKLIIQ